MLKKILTSLLLILMSGFACCVRDTTTVVEGGETYYNCEPPEDAPKSSWKKFCDSFYYPETYLEIKSDDSSSKKTKYRKHSHHNYSNYGLVLKSPSGHQTKIAFEDSNGPMQIDEEEFCLCILGKEKTLFITPEQILELLTTTDNAKFNQLLTKYHLSTPTVQDDLITFKVGTTDAHDVESISLPLSSIDIEKEKALKREKEARIEAMKQQELEDIKAELEARKSPEQREREAKKRATRAQTEADLQKLKEAGIEAFIRDINGYLIFYVETPKGKTSFQMVIDFDSIEFNARFVEELIANPKVREELQRIAEADFEGELLRGERPRGGENENTDGRMYIETVNLPGFGLYQVYLAKSNKSSLGGTIYTNPMDFEFTHIKEGIRVVDLTSYDHTQRLVIGDAIYDDNLSEKTTFTDEHENKLDVRYVRGSGFITAGEKKIEAKDVFKITNKDAETLAKYGLTESDAGLIVRP